MEAGSTFDNPKSVLTKVRSRRRAERERELRDNERSLGALGGRRIGGG